jgi:hypothetical protein
VPRGLSRLTTRLDAWAEYSRLNPYRFLVMRNPALSDTDRAAFDRLLTATPDGGDVAYDLDQPKWWFLHHAVQSGLLLHGTNEGGLEKLGTRATGDAHGAPVNAAFATDDAIWPLYFATVRRAGLRYGYINWATHVRGASRYIFSIGADPADPGSWSDGTIYLLPAASFRQTPSSREFVSSEPVKVRARLAVSPDDFPFRDQTIEHGPDATPMRIVLRHALRNVRTRPRMDS